MRGLRGLRAIGIALRQKDFKKGVMGKNRCLGSSHQATRRGGKRALGTLPAIIVSAEPPWVLFSL